MRVLYFSRDYTPHDFRFLFFLSESEHEIHYLRLEKSAFALEQRELPEGIIPVEWAGGKDKFSYKDSGPILEDLRRVVKRIKPDLVHAGPIPLTAYLTALIGFKPMVSMSWGSDLLLEATLDSQVEWVCRFTLKHSSILLGDCEAVSQKAISLGFPKDKIVLFPWGVDLNLFKPGKNSLLREQLGWSGNFVLISLRSWEPLYGVDVIVRAFALASEFAPQLRLLLLGGGSQAGLIHDLLKENNLENKVHLGGLINNKDLPPYYQAADLYISASHSDGSSVSLLEALASGLPAVVSDIPGNKEWIEENKQGWLFKDGDFKDLAEKIMLVVNEMEKQPLMSKAARELATQRADERKNFKKLEKAYQMALLDK